MMYFQGYGLMGYDFTSVPTAQCQFWKSAVVILTAMRTLNIGFEN
jgi:hypothetical protein